MQYMIHSTTKKMIRSVNIRGCKSNKL